MGVLRDRAAFRLAGPLLFVLLLAAVSLLLQREKDHRHQQLRKESARYAAMVAATPIERVKDNRARFYETGFYLDYPQTVSYQVADFLVRLHGMMPPLQLFHFQVDTGLHGFHFELSVAAAAAGPGDADQRFLAFFERLRACPELTQLSWSAKAPTALENRMIVFSISGQSEWQ